jgi:hypothetical protein
MGDPRVRLETYSFVSPSKKKCILKSQPRTPFSGGLDLLLLPQVLANRFAFALQMLEHQQS